MVNAELMWLTRTVSQVVSWNIRCTGGWAPAPAEMVLGWTSEELQTSFEPVQLALAPEKALQVVAAVATVATTDATAQAQGAMERWDSQGRSRL